MPSYATSGYKQIKSRKQRYTVTYENEDNDEVSTFGITAHSLTEAAMGVIEFIEKHDLHRTAGHYFLTPKRVKQKTDYNVNT